MRLKYKAVGLPALALAAVLIGGCGGSDATIDATTTTMGQELTDLKKAYDSGIISEKEYERSKEKILERYD